MLPNSASNEHLSLLIRYEFVHFAIWLLQGHVQSMIKVRPKLKIANNSRDCGKCWNWVTLQHSWLASDSWASLFSRKISGIKPYWAKNENLKQKQKQKIGNNPKMILFGRHRRCCRYHRRMCALISRREKILHWNRLACWVWVELISVVFHTKRKENIYESGFLHRHHQ